MIKVRNDQVLITKELRMRITDLEYQYNWEPSSLSEEEFIREIERIYLEEVGKQIPTDISVYKSAESEILKDDNGYDGTALHFFSEQYW